jgi:hypothetical protein
MSNVLMSCGCTTPLTRQATGEPSCMWHPEAEPVLPMPDLSARVARCYCGEQTPSSPKLAFFELRPTYTFDTYYCGCAGWE